MALTERYVSALAGGAGSGASEASPFTWDQMITEIKSAAGTGGQGKRYNIKADGTYNRSAFDDIGGGGTGTNTLPVIARGYKTTIGDGYLGRATDNGALITTNMPLISYATNNGFNWGKLSVLESIQFTGSRDWALLSLAQYSSMFGCLVTNAGPTNALAVLATEGACLWECDLICSTTTGATNPVLLCDADGVRVLSCRIFSNSNNATTTGIKVGKWAVLYGNLIRGGGSGYGVSQEQDNWTFLAANNTIAKWGDAIRMTAASNGTSSIIWGNMITDNSGYAVNASVAGNMFFFGPNRGRDNTSGNIAASANNDWAAGGRFWPLVTTGSGAAADYTDAAANNYNLVSTSPGRQANRPLWLDLGAYDMKDPSGGGGAAVFNPLGQFIIRPALQE